MIKRSLIVCLIFLCNFQVIQGQDRTLLFVGSFTNKKPDTGIHVFDFNTKSGEAKLLSAVDSVINSSFLKLSPNGQYLYSVIESQLQTHGKIAAFKIDSDAGDLKLINMQDCGGRNPAHIEIDKSGKYLAVSNYTDPSLSFFEVNETGEIKKFDEFFTFTGSSIIKGNQDTAHIHSSNFSPENDYLFLQDLGSDCIHNFKVIENANQKMSLRKAGAIKVKPGSGPRHFVFHQNGKYGYGINELSGKVSAYALVNGNLKFLADYNAYSKKQEIYRSADIHISPDGKFLYASNRGPSEDSIVIFSINKNNGALKLIGHEPTYGEHPRNFAIDPSGKFLLVANQFSNNIVIFRRDVETGKLQKLPQELTVDGASSLQMFSYDNH
ncbi:lactonase family protein [Tamlana sp. I1]|uniref:lactonase family protein n=1 Tax=Tamlana sp. I1 TaxID=2762061 RepID=UPI00189007C4|nr:lactonase family protein [Tamlana sp. I1]